MENDDVRAIVKGHGARGSCFDATIFHNDEFVEDRIKAFDMKAKGECVVDADCGRVAGMAEIEIDAF